MGRSFAASPPNAACPWPTSGWSPSRIQASTSSWTHAWRHGPEPATWSSSRAWPAGSPPTRPWPPSGSWIACEPAERARRVADRDGLTSTPALAANLERERSEAARYLTYYGIDLADLSVYDLVLDSTATPPEDLVAAILDRAR